MWNYVVFVREHCRFITSYIFAQNKQAFHITQNCVLWHISACIVSFFSEFQQGKWENRATVILFTQNGTLRAVVTPVTVVKS